MRTVILILLIILSTIIQSTVLAPLSGTIFAIDIVLTITVIIAVLNGVAIGSIVGLLSGIFQDAVLGRPIGITAMSRLLVCYLIGVIEPKVFKENLLIPATLVFFATIVDQFLASLFAPMIGISIGDQNLLTSFNINAAVANMLAAIVVYTPLYRLNKRFTKQQSTRRF